MLPPGCCHRNAVAAMLFLLWHWIWKSDREEVKPVGLIVSLFIHQTPAECALAILS
jgi:hypothetical protein